MLRSGIVLDYAPLVPSDLEDTDFILQVEAIALLVPRSVTSTRSLLRPLIPPFYLSY